MILTTTNSIEGFTVKEYKGIVTGETIIGANFFKDFKANLTDFFGGRSKTYEKVLIEAKQTALKELEEKAMQLGANAVIGIHIDYETLGAKGSMLMVSICGTGVII
ncbi:MAG: YbjQ family protein [Apibacter sp.]|nr:YbjQ family protein [Apibacter sp.]